MAGATPDAGADAVAFLPVPAFVLVLAPACAEDAALGATGAPSAASRRLVVAAAAGAGASRCVAMTDSASVAAKNTVAHTAVERERKFALPVAPNKLPDAPLPNEAPMSAPLP